MDKSKGFYILVAIAVQVLMLVSYVFFFMIIYRETAKGRKYDDLILHK